MSRTNGQATLQRAKCKVGENGRRCEDQSPPSLTPTRRSNRGARLHEVVVRTRVTSRSPVTCTLVCRWTGPPEALVGGIQMSAGGFKKGQLALAASATRPLSGAMASSRSGLARTKWLIQMPRLSIRVVRTKRPNASLQNARKQALALRSDSSSYGWNHCRAPLACVTLKGAHLAVARLSGGRAAPDHCSKEKECRRRRSAAAIRRSKRSRRSCTRWPSCWRRRRRPWPTLKSRSSTRLKRMHDSVLQLTPRRARAHACRQLNQLIAAYKAADDMRDTPSPEALVPIEVLERLDKMEGDNDPSIFTKQVLERFLFDTDALQRFNDGCAVRSPSAAAATANARAHAATERGAQVQWRRRRRRRRDGITVNLVHKSTVSAQA